MKTQVVSAMRKSIRYLLTVSVFLSLAACRKEKPWNVNLATTDQMRFIADSLIQTTKIPGLVALVVDKKRGINWVYAGGVASLSDQAPMNSGYVFRIGSNTKTFIGTVFLQLVEEGKLSLDDKVSKYFPNYPKADAITLAMLCNMTSGIPDYTRNTLWGNVMEAAPAKRWTPQELLAWAFSENFLFEPGTKFSYSNSNTILLGIIIEKITGNSLEAEIRQRITQPLQLTQTALITSGTGFPGPHARGYYEGSFVAGNDQTEKYDYSYIWAAGSAYSTPHELQRYVEALVGGGLLSPVMQRRRLEEMRELAPRLAYGLGMFRRGSFYGHNGTVTGYTSSMYHSNLRDCSVIIYFNAMLELHPDYLFERFMAMLYGPEY